MFSKNKHSKLIFKLGFLNHLNITSGNMVSSYGISNNIPILKVIDGITKIYGNVNLEVRQVGDLPISLTLSIGVNQRLKFKKSFDMGREIIVKNLEFSNVKKDKAFLFSELRKFYSENNIH